MGIPWSGDGVRHMMAASQLQKAGLSAKATEVLLAAGVFSLDDFLNAPWSDEDAGRRFASLQWRMSVQPGCSAKMIAQVEAVRARYL